MPKNPGIRRDDGSISNGTVRSRALQTPTAPAARGRPLKAGSSFAARFGRIILQHGIAAIPSALFHYQGKLELSAQQVWFVSYVLSHKWDEDLPYPSLKKMAKCTLLSLSQLQRIKNTLCQADMLTVLPRFGEKRSQQTNAYDFSGLFEQLEDLILGDPPTHNEIRAEGDAPDVGEAVEADPSFVARYGRVIARHGVAAVPRAIFTHQRDLNLTPQQVWFTTYIFSFQWDTVLPYPSIRRMAATTGYSRVQLHNIKAELVEAGYLRLVRRSNEQGGQDTNAYDFSGLLDAIRAQLQPETPPTKDVAQEEAAAIARPLMPRRGRRVKQLGEDSVKLSGVGSVQLPKRGSAGLPAGGRTQLPDGGSVQFTSQGVIELIGVDSAKLSRAGRAQLPRPANQEATGGIAPGYHRGIARDLPEEEAIKVETNNEDDSNHLPQKRGAKKRNANDDAPTTYSPYIAEVITDFSMELNDSTHTIPNVTQALRLWQMSGLEEQNFTELMYEAKRRTRQYQSKQGLGSINNKMAYFFVTLRDLCND